MQPATPPTPAPSSRAAALQALGEPYPPRGSVEVLAERVAAVLRGGEYGVGDRFFTDEELMAATGLSRSSVRRALGGLRDEGWLRRRVGRGTYVGRTSDATPGPREAPPRRPAAAAPAALRVGVLAFSGRSPAHDWFTGDVMRGISSGGDAAAASGADDAVPLRVELLGGYTDTLAGSLARLEASAPDVLVCLSSSPDDAMLVRMASERGMKCIVAGTVFPELDEPRVCEDNRQGVRMVVRELAERGHGRVGLVMRRWNGPWVFERHEQWLASCAEFGVAADEALVHWLPGAERDLLNPTTDDRLAGWIERAKPTAVVCGHYAPVENLGHLVRAGRLKVPGDLAVAVIDQQHPLVARQLGVEPSGAVTPLHEIGARVARLAAGWARGVTPERLTRLPMRWHEGATTPRR